MKWKVDQVLNADEDGHRHNIPANAVGEPRNYTTSEAGYQPVDNPLLTVVDFHTQYLMCLVCRKVRGHPFGGPASQVEIIFIFFTLNFQ